MKLFERLFGRGKKETTSVKKQSKISEKDDWEELPAYVAASPEDFQLVSVIATAIAAGDSPESQFVVKRIMQRNPEVQKVALISASLAAEYETESQLVIKNIKKRV